MSYENFVQLQLDQPAAAADATLAIRDAVAPYNLPPEDGGVLVLADNMYKPSALEVVRYASRTGLVLNDVQRGVEGTAPRDWAAGSVVFMSLTAGGVDAILQSIDAKAAVGSVVPAANGTASAGTSATAARADHVHPLQTSVSGNAGTATKLATARTINGVPFDGTANITVTDSTKAAVGSVVPAANGTASAGTSATAARADHVHPLQPLARPGDVLQTARFEGGGFLQRTSGFGTNLIRGVAHGNGLWVAGGTNGLLATSTDGITWTQQTSSFGTTTIHGAAHASGLWVSVGDSGKLATSTDGITWTQQTSSFGTTPIWGVAHGNGLWVAVGLSGKLATSTDGITWTQQTSGFWTNIIWGVAHANGLWVAVGSSGMLTTSTDGITWTQQTSSFGTTTIRGVAHANGLWVSVGDSGKLATSTDGITWTQQTSSFETTTIRSVAHGNGLWVAVGDSGKLATSTDGITWTQRTGSFGTATIWGVAHGNGLWVAVGNSGLLATISDKSLLALADGYLACSGSVYLQSAYPALFAALGTLRDTWNTPTFAINTPFGSTVVRSITYGNGLWLAVGDSGKIQTSQDGVNWTQQTSGQTVHLLRVIYANGLFVVGAASGRILTSPDGINWTQRTSSLSTSYSINSVAYGNGMFVAVNAYGGIASSPDGITWTARTSNLGTGVIGGVAYGGGVFVAAVSEASYATSPDGITWTQRGMGQTTSNAINAVGFAGGVFVAAGASGRVLTSPDGLAWTLRASGTASTLRGISGDEGLLVVLGDSGAGIMSDDGGATWRQFTGLGVHGYGAEVANGMVLIGGASGRIAYGYVPTYDVSAQFAVPRMIAPVNQPQFFIKA